MVTMVTLCRKYLKSNTIRCNHNVLNGYTLNNRTENEVLTK